MASWRVVSRQCRLKTKLSGQQQEHQPYFCDVTALTGEKGEEKMKKKTAAAAAAAVLKLTRSINLGHI